MIGLLFILSLGMAVFVIAMLVVYVIGSVKP